MQELEDEVKHLKAEAKNVKYMLEDKEFEHKQANEEIEQLRKKIERATGLCQQLQKQLRRARKTKHKTDDEVCCFWLRISFKLRANYLTSVEIQI